MVGSPHPFLGDISKAVHGRGVSLVRTERWHCPSVHIHAIPSFQHGSTFLTAPAALEAPKVNLCLEPSRFWTAWLLRAERKCTQESPHEVLAVKMNIRRVLAWRATEWRSAERGGEQLPGRTKMFCILTGVVITQV